MLFAPNSMLSPDDRHQAGLAGLLALSQGLVAGAAPSLQPGGLGRGLAQGFGGFGQAYQGSANNAIMQKSAALQQQMAQTQLAEAQRKAEFAKQWQSQFAPPSAQNVQLAMAGGEGPTPGNAARLPQNPLLANVPPALHPIMADPDKGPALAMQLAMRESDPSKRYKEINGQLIDLGAQGGPRNIMTVPEQMKPPANTTWVDPKDPSKGVTPIPGAKDAYADLEAAKFNATLKGRLQVAEAGRSQVTVDNRGEMEEQKQFGGDLVKEYSSIRERAVAAEDARNQIRMARAFADTDQTGKPLPSVLQQKAGNAAVALGFNVESPAMKATLGRISDGQSFTGTMQNLVLTKMQAQKGPQTENDAKRIEQTVASLGNTPEARDFLLRAADALSFEDTFKRQHWDKHMTDKKTFMGAAKSWGDFRKDVPFMGVSPNTGKPAFFSEFYEANRDKPANEVIAAWRQQYGR